MQALLVVGIHSAKYQKEGDVSTSTFVIGNGESRSPINLNKLRGYKIGCNAIFRDYHVDSLVCVDKRLAKEATDNPDTIESKIYVREKWYHYFRKIQKNKNIHTVPELPYQGHTRPDNPDHWGSGPYAVLLGSQSECKTIFLLGFDLYGKRGKVNNVYKNTPNYAPSSRREVDHSYWVYQIQKVFQINKDKKFIIVNSDNWELPAAWNQKNTKLITTEFFIKNYCK